MFSLQNSRWWLKFLDHCHPCEKSEWSSWFVPLVLSSLGVAGIWGVNQQNGRALSLRSVFQINKNKKIKALHEMGVWFSSYDTACDACLPCQSPWVWVLPPLLIQLPTNAYSGRKQVMAHILIFATHTGDFKRKHPWKEAIWEFYILWNVCTKSINTFDFLDPGFRSGKWTNRCRLS